MDCEEDLPDIRPAVATQLAKLDSLLTHVNMGARAQARGDEGEHGDQAAVGALG